MNGSGPDGVLRLAAGGVEVGCWIDHTYTRRSADNVHAYDREIAFTDAPRYAWQAMGVRVSQGQAVLGSAVLLLPIGCAEPGARTLLLRPGTLFVPCGGEVAALEVPSLQVRWETRSSLGCVMGLHEIPGQDALIVHGEISVARVEPDGRLAWEHLGRDVFSGELRIMDGVVEVTDHDRELYRFRVADGEMLAGPPYPTGPADHAPSLGERLRGWLWDR